MKHLYKSLLLLVMCAPICACSSNQETKESIYGDYKLNTYTKGQLMVYVFQNYGSASYQPLESYDAPLTLKVYSSSFQIEKDTTTYYYSMPMYQFSYIVE